ncbi:MAG: YceI family protein [Pseudomonadota bacterium]
MTIRLFPTTFLRRIARPLALACATLVAATVPSHAAQLEFILDKSHQYIAFEASHLGFSPVRGRFQDVDATLMIDEANPETSTVRVVIQTASVDSDHAARDGHLRSPDFLSAEAHPEIVFESTAIRFDETAEGHPQSGTITGDLTLRGVTKPASLSFELLRDAPFPFPGYNNVRTLGFKAQGTIRRAEWGMTYALGEIIADEVELTLNFDAVHCVGDAAKAPSCTYGR